MAGAFGEDVNFYDEDENEDDPGNPSLTARLLHECS